MYLVLLWPNEAGRWAGRIKVAKTGAEIPFSGIEELLSWLEAHKNDEPRRFA